MAVFIVCMDVCIKYRGDTFVSTQSASHPLRPISCHHGAFSHGIRVKWLNSPFPPSTSTPYCLLLSFFRIILMCCYVMLCYGGNFYSKYEYTYMMAGCTRSFVHTYVYATHMNGMYTKIEKNIYFNVDFYLFLY